MRPCAAHPASRGKHCLSIYPIYIWGDCVGVPYSRENTAYWSQECGQVGHIQMHAPLLRNLRSKRHMSIEQCSVCCCSIDRCRTTFLCRRRLTYAKRRRVYPHFEEICITRGSATQPIDEYRCRAKIETLKRSKECLAESQDQILVPTVSCVPSLSLQLRTCQAPRDGASTISH